MKPILIVDASVVAGQGRLIEAGAISALLRLGTRFELAVTSVEGVPRWDEIEALLEGEGIRFLTLEREALDGRSGVRLTSAPDGRGGATLAELEDPMNPRDIGWGEVARRLMYPRRVARVDRSTSETSISVTVNLDGTGAADIETGLGFLDHMLEQVARHSRADIALTASGDLHVDEHHTVEDAAIALGEAFADAIGDKRGVERYAFVLPMDDALASVAFDWSGRSWLVWEAEFKREKVGDVPTEMFFHFFKSFADAARCNLNIRVEGENEHHKIESVFKAFGRCLGQASRRREDDDSVPSTKGVL